MRLGAPVFERYEDPEGWIAALRRLGYGAAYCPIDESQSDDVVRAYARAAQTADVVIAEVGAWSNPLSRDDEVRRQAIAYCQQRLALADRIGARCCVNVAGSLGEGDSMWSLHPDNLTRYAFDLIVESVRTIIDAVRPTRTFYALEMMPAHYPDSADCYLELIRAIDRKELGVHLDPVNIVSSPQRYYGNAALIRECFAKLGPWVKSCHAKDTILRHELTVHIDETRPGVGALDYRAYLQELDKLGPDMPLMIEHLRTAEEYVLAAGHIRAVAGEVGVAIKGI